jgi:ABC-type Na+ efflux pump permease subunit
MTHPSPASPVQAFLAGFVNVPLYIIGCFVPTHLALSWAPTAMLLRLPLTEVPLIDIGISIGVLVLVIPVALWASTKLFRAGMLLYGQRPGFQQIIHILRQT